MSKRSLQEINQDNSFRDAHASIKAMRQKIQITRVALDRWDSAKNDVALKAAENKWRNRTKGNIFRAWYKAVVMIKEEREEERKHPKEVIKVDNSSETFKQYGSMIDLVRGMKSRCENATHILDVNHELEHNNNNNNNNNKMIENVKKEYHNQSQYSPQQPQHQHSPCLDDGVNVGREMKTEKRNMSPLSELSERIHREARQKEIELRNTYNLPLEHFESISPPIASHYNSYKASPMRKEKNYRSSSPQALSSYYKPYVSNRLSPQQQNKRESEYQQHHHYQHNYEPQYEHHREHHQHGHRSYEPQHEHHREHQHEHHSYEPQYEHHRERQHEHSSNEPQHQPQEETYSHYHATPHQPVRHSTPSTPYSNIKMHSNVGLTPQAPMTTTTRHYPTTVKRSRSPLNGANHISDNFYKPVTSPDRTIPTWLKYKHQDYY